MISLFCASLGHGAITFTSVTLLNSSSSFQSDPPTFTLAGVTSGGPPTTYTWTRNGEVIADGGPYNISIAVTADTQEFREIASYTSRLLVTGHLPGVYQYTVSNRATNQRADSSNIQGKNSEGLQQGSEENSALCLRLVD